MADRTVKVKLTADISEYTAQLAKAAAATRQLGGAVEKGMDRNVAPAMRRAGERQGGLLARGINNGLVRNSPLIAAGVAAALAAGAPAMLAGATALFGGIGAVAAAQNSVVRDAWTDLGHEIRDGAVEDASVLVPVYVGMAEKIGDAFQRMRPELREAFAAAAPQIDQFTDSLTQAAENAMPGLLRAVERGGPVIEGLGNLMESIGTGLSDFLDAMSDNSGAAGDALTALGEALGNALPLLGELLGTGSEIASVALPLLADGLGAVHAVAKLLGPILPGLVLGFAGFKVAQAAAGYMQTFAVQAQYAATAMTGSVAAGQKVGGALAGLGKALPAVGIAVGVVGTIMQTAEQQTDDWARALLAGGAAAEAASKQMSELESAWDSSLGTVAALAPGMGAFANQLGIGGDAAEQAAEKADELYQAMSKVDQASQDVTTAQNNLELAVGRFGPASSEAAAAQDALSAATARSASEQANLELAIHGVTNAMLEQANQALAAANSQFAYESAQLRVRDAQANLNAVMADSSSTTSQVAAAQLQLNMALLAQAEAAGRAAQDASGLGDSLRGQQVAAQGTLQELYRLRDVMGAQFPPALQSAINGLQNSGAAMGGASASAQIAAGSVRNLIGTLIDVGGRNPRPTVGVNDQASGILGGIISRLGQIVSKTITVTTIQRTAIAGALALTPGAAKGGGIVNGQLVQHFDAGGAVRGLGGPTADQVPAMLSNGEHVWTAAEVSAAGGQAAVAAMRRAVLSGREFAGGRGVGGSISVGSPVIHITLDGRELRYMARTEAAGVVASDAADRARNMRSSLS